MNKHHDDKAYLFDILDGCQNIKAFIKGIEFQEFESDIKTHSAVQKQLITMGEAANKTSSELKSVNPNIPWKEMIAVRNILVHGYMSVDLEIVWNIASQRIDEMIPELEKLLKA